MKSKNNKNYDQGMFDGLIESLLVNFFRPILQRLESLESKIEKALIRSSNDQIQEIKSRPMTLADLCEYLDCSASSVYTKVSRSEIPFHKEPSGRRLYFIKEEIDNWLIGKK
jgi:excisionase family DNA binding protein